MKTDYWTMIRPKFQYQGEFMNIKTIFLELETRICPSI